jgi:hypothetical protein
VTVTSVDVPVSTGAFVEAEIEGSGSGEALRVTPNAQAWAICGGSFNRFFLWQSLRCWLVPGWLVSVNEGVGAWLTVVGDRRVEVRGREGRLIESEVFASERDACEAVLEALSEPPDWVWADPSPAHVELAFERERRPPFSAVWLANNPE